MAPNLQANWMVPALPEVPDKQTEDKQQVNKFLVKRDANLVRKNFLCSRQTQLFPTEDFPVIQDMAMHIASKSTFC